MPEVSGSRLAELTGHGWRTIKARLEQAGIRPIRRERNADLFDSAAALAAIYGSGDGDGETTLDLNRERARLAKMQADKTEQEVELRAGRMLDADAVNEWITGMLGAVTARLVQIPDAVAQLVDQQHAAAIKEACRRPVYEALEDLGSNARRVPRGHMGATEAAADTDGERVGRPVSPPVERVKRRAGAVEN